MRVALGNDHAGLPIKAAIMAELQELGHEVVDYGTDETRSVDYPDFAAPVGNAVSSGEADRGILICGSGIGMCIAVNKMHGIRASVTHDTYSARQGVEHDDMNVMCLGGKIIGELTARELVRAFAAAEFQREARYQRRIDKVIELEARR
jgi:ribose 5-phosphate isomerase B